MSMLIENDRFIVNSLNENDFDRLTEIYNSNKYFLSNHIGAKSVSKKWIEKEYETMQEVSFSSYKIISKATNEIIGICDLKIGNTVYLSLLMIDGNLKGQGLGSDAYGLLEQYFREEKCSRIRIDVVYNYPNNVVGFWEKFDFIKDKEIELEWNNVILKAYVMIKELSSHISAEKER